MTQPYEHGGVACISKERLIYLGTFPPNPCFPRNCLTWGYQVATYFLNEVASAGQARLFALVQQFSSRSLEHESDEGFVISVLRHAKLGLAKVHVRHLAVRLPLEKHIRTTIQLRLRC